MRAARLAALGALAAAAAAGAAQFLVGDPMFLVETPFYGREGVDALRQQQLILATDLMAAGTITRWEWRAATPAAPGRFYRCRLLLCHVTRTALGATFAANYDGRTPTQVFYADPALVAMYPNTWFGVDLAPTFEYNGVDNLLLEVWWEGDDGAGGKAWATNVTGQERDVAARVVNGVPDGGYPDTGRVTARLGYMRLTITGAAVEATSLGRVKALFR